jgi:hypothetical protein
VQAHLAWAGSCLGCAMGEDVPRRLGGGRSREYPATRWRHLLTRVDALEGLSCWSMRHSRSLACLFGRSSVFFFSWGDVGLARAEGAL